MLLGHETETKRGQVQLITKWAACMLSLRHAKANLQSLGMARSGKLDLSLLLFSRIMGMVQKSTCAIFEISLSILGFTNPSRNLNAKSAASDRRSLSNIVRGWSPAECMYLDRFSKLRRSRRDRCFQSLSLTSARSPVFHIPSIALLLHHHQQPHIHKKRSLTCTRFA